jgi:hypothetical protein
MQARAVPRAETAPCKAIADKIVSATNAHFQQLSELGTRVFFQHPSARDLSLSCTSPEKIGVFVRWDAAEPPAAFFDLATKAGVATTGELMSPRCRVAPNSPRPRRRCRKSSARLSGAKAAAPRFRSG